MNSSLSCRIARSGPVSAHGSARAIIALLLGAATSISCANMAGGDSAGPAFEVIDSAGVEIDRNSPADRPGAAVLSRREALRIGVREGAPELELYNVRDVAVGSDGEIFAALQNDGEIRVFAADGTWLRTIGRQGVGPGEFRFLSWIGAFGDTLLAFDPQLYRITVFTTTGDLLDTWQARRGYATLFPRAPTAGGWFVELDDFGARVPYDIGRPGTDTARITVLPSIPDALDRLSSEVPPWRIFDVILKYPRWTTWGIGSPGGVVFGRHALWEPRERHAYDAHGRIYLARGIRYAIDVFDAAGTLQRRITREHEPVLITEDLVDRYRDAVLSHYDTASTTGEAGLDLVEAAHQQIALPRPPHLPSLGEIVVSADGAIWVERPDLVDDPLLLEWSRAGTQPERWDVFDPAGRFVGTVEMPVRSTLHVVGDDWMIVTQRDELDVQYIVRYGIGQ